MANDEPIRLTADEAQAVIIAQRDEIRALRSDLQEMGQRMSDLFRVMLERVGSQDWCCSSLKRDAAALSDDGK